ncbi:MAG: hypothetical protein ACRELY_28600 [Polyangiaceae bacterium]
MKRGSSAARAVARTMTAISESVILPGPLDSETAVPPTLKVLSRRVRGENLWILFRVRTDDVIFLYLVKDPPVPVDG